MDVHKENLRSCNRHEERIYTEEGKGIPTVEGRERRGTGVHTGTTEERIHLTLKVTPNGTSVLCRKEGWKEEDGIGLLIPQ